MQAVGELGVDDEVAGEKKSELFGTLDARLGESYHFSYFLEVSFSVSISKERQKYVLVSSA